MILKRLNTEKRTYRSKIGTVCLHLHLQSLLIVKIYDIHLAESKHSTGIVPNDYFLAICVDAPLLRCYGVIPLSVTFLSYSEHCTIARSQTTFPPTKAIHY